jgi:hypothetical protein
MMTRLGYRHQLQTVRSGYDRRFCWVQTRAGVIPPDTRVMTTQQLRLSGSDIFYGIHDLRSDDRGLTWTGPTAQPGLDRELLAHGIECCPCDGTPTWHAVTGRLLMTGHVALYRGNHLAPPEHYRRSTFYAVYDEPSRSWAKWRRLVTPDETRFFDAGSGCGQRVDLPGGDLLLPVYFRQRVDGGRSAAAVFRCGFDGEHMWVKAVGEPLTLDVARGLCEPSLVHYRGRYLMTLRNDVQGYVTASSDGLQYAPIRPWTFDDGSELGNYNTQQHWLAHSDALFLVYTRRDDHNTHVFRQRAPLYMAQVDAERLCVIRDTERVVVPERGARLGNFGIVDVSSAESWVVVSEWMQTTPPDPTDCRACEQYGSDNAILVARLLWDSPNDRTTGFC